MSCEYDDKMTAQYWPHRWTTMMAANNCDLLFKLAAKGSVAFRYRPRLYKPQEN